MQLVTDDVGDVAVLPSPCDDTSGDVQDGLKRAQVLHTNETENAVAVVVATGNESVGYRFRCVEC